MRCRQVCRSAGEQGFLVCGGSRCAVSCPAVATIRVAKWLHGRSGGAAGVDVPSTVEKPGFTVEGGEIRERERSRVGMGGGRGIRLQHHGGSVDRRRSADRCSATARPPDVLVQMICARVLARSACSQSARDRQICATSVTVGSGAERLSDSSGMPARAGRLGSARHAEELKHGMQELRFAGIHRDVLLAWHDDRAGVGKRRFKQGGRLL